MADFIKKTLWLCVLLAVVVARGEAADSILRRGAASSLKGEIKSLKGEIKSQNPNQVTIELKLGGIDEEVSVNEIRRIRYDDQPDALTTAQNKYATRNYQDVVNTLRTVNVDAIERRMIRQDIQYLRNASAAHLALGGVGSAAKAAAAMQNFLKEYPGSYHTYAANEMMGNLAVAAGKPGKADAYYQKAKAPWPESELRLALARARAFAAQKNYEKAISTYQAVLDSSEQGDQANRYRLTATLGKASALAETGQGKEGVDSVVRVIRASEKGDSEIQALAYNALGNCYRAMQQPKEAVLQYLHTDTMYFQDPVTHAEALGRLAQLWDQLKQPERAARARKTLNNRYPNSAWNQ